MLVLCTSCSSSALHAQPLQLVADLGTLQFVVELCSSCFSILNLGLLHFAARDSAIIISDFYSSQLVHEQDACSSCSSISQLVLKQDACSSSLPSLIGLLRKAKWCWTALLLPSWCTALSFAAAELDCFVAAELDCFVAAELDRLVAVELGCCAAAKLVCCFGLWHCRAGLLCCYRAGPFGCCRARLLCCCQAELLCCCCAWPLCCYRAGLLCCCRAGALL
ncbi:hypothetical protein SLEP1_g14033 [Rubroshorea leprosula]|uniref:Uncharacterized protein n=1 Tax=Rubroshorea leprosula TaxID=152421 RepID=A0AAV5IT94_9ROSI|nr:hypothetical protein SLEP1_g14033 [Rubroshorea leprosula]